MKNQKQIWTEIRNDYTEQGTGLTSIDAWTSLHADDEGKSIATVDLDGNVIYKDERAKTDKFAQEAIQEILVRNEETKQKLVDAVYLDIKKNLEEGDGTTLEELLKMIPSANLVQALPEEDWKYYPEAEDVAQEQIRIHQSKK
jgi:hypothetical protein